MIRFPPTFAALALGTALLTGCAAPDPDEELVVFAAASLRDVMADLAESYQAPHGATLVFNFAGSNALAQQLLAAPRGQIFLSADRAWVDTLEDRGTVATGSRRAVFGNRLVLVANVESDPPPAISRLEDLAALEGRRLVLADPTAVPAGRYARAALSAVPIAGSTLWQRIASRTVPTADARAALNLVESTPDLLGIVYRTDADSSSRVRVLCGVDMPPELPISYWAVAIGDVPSSLGRAFLDFLVSPPAQRIVEDHGFLPLE